MVVLAAAGLLAAWSASGSSPLKLTAKLSARAERPAPKGAASATGVFTATLTGSSLTWRLTFSQLTGKAAAAHIHIGRAGVAGPVAVPLCGPCASGAHGTVRLNSKTKAALLAGRRLRQRPHGEERRRRDPRPGPRRRRHGAVRTTTHSTDHRSDGDAGGYGGYG